MTLKSACEEKRCQSCLLLCNPVTGINFLGGILHCNSRGERGYTGMGRDMLVFQKTLRGHLSETTGYVASTIWRRNK